MRRIRGRYARITTWLALKSRSPYCLRRNAGMKKRTDYAGLLESMVPLRSNGYRETPEKSTFLKKI